MLSLGTLEPLGAVYYLAFSGCLDQGPTEVPLRVEPTPKPDGQREEGSCG